MRWYFLCVCSLLGNTGDWMCNKGWWAHLSGQAEWCDVATPLPMFTTKGRFLFRMQGQWEPVGLWNMTSDSRRAVHINDDQMCVLGWAEANQWINVRCPLSFTFVDVHLFPHHSHLTPGVEYSRSLLLTLVRRGNSSFLSSFLAVGWHGEKNAWCV